MSQIAVWTSRHAEAIIRAAHPLNCNFEGVTLTQFEKLANARAEICPCEECVGIRENAFDVFLAALTSAARSTDTGRPAPVHQFENQGRIAVRVLAGIDTDDEGVSDDD